MSRTILDKLSIAGLALVTAVIAGATLSTAAETKAECETLFVQSAKSVAMDSKTLTLKGISPLVTFFCDRPTRHAGHLTLAEFLQSWDYGKDSFTADPPNAVLSVLDGDTADDVVIELLDKPRISGDELTYDIKIIDGTATQKNGPGSLFIDIIGRPLTPLSYAGVARRTTRRAVRACAYGVTCW